MLSSYIFSTLSNLTDANILKNLDPNSSTYTRTQDTDFWLIKDLKWGSLKIGSTIFRDVRVWPQYAEEWDWNTTGTRHNPGIQKEDLEDFIDQVDIIVLSQGVEGVLQIKPETIEYLNEKEKAFFIALTPIAVEKYNELLAQGIRVGALIHSTC